MNVSEFLTYVKFDYKREDKDTEIIQSINDAITYISLLMPLGNYKYQSYVSLVLAQEDYPLPSDLMHLIHPVRFLEGVGTSDEGYPLSQLTKEEYDVMFPNPNRSSPDNLGTPKFYCSYARSILVGPLPEQSIITDGALLEINWTKKELTLDSIVNTTKSLGSEWDQVLKQIVLADMYDMIELYQEGAVWREKFEDSEGNPRGVLKRLLDREKEIEGRATGKVQNNLL
jgi:hypothetical protein